MVNRELRQGKENIVCWVSEILNQNDFWFLKMRGIPLKQIVEKTIKKHHMLEKGDKVVIGVSGGPDSITLLHLLYYLKDSWQLDLVVAHFDHMLRPESSNEGDFVALYAKKLEVPAFVEKGDVGRYAKERGLSIQVAARELRYRFLEEIAQKTSGKKIALAHHLVDQGETILMNFLRGPSPRGLAGIPPVRDKIIRPLIEITRQQIESYVKDNQLETVTDFSNYDKKYLRNQIRLEMIPALEKYNPNLMLGLARGGEIFREEDQYLEQVTKAVFNRICLTEETNKISVSYGHYKTLALAMKRRLLRKCFTKLVDENRELGFDEVERVITWLENPISGKILEWPEEIKIRYSLGRIIIGKLEMAAQKGKNTDFQRVLPSLGKIKIGSSSFLAEIANVEKPFKKNNPWEVFLDADKVSFPLTIRNRRQGDRFYPLGLGGSKKLKDFFIDLKIPQEKRKRTPLVVSSKGEIIWVVGFRIDERFKVTETTKTILRLSLIKTITGDEFV